MNDQRPPAPQPEEPITLKVEELANSPAPASSAGKWQMPDPVFRKSSGYLPQGFEKRYENLSGPAPETPDIAAGVGASVQPQPGISEEFSFEAAAVEPSQVKPLIRPAFIIAAVLAMLLFAAAFLALIYFLFFFPADTV